MFETICVMFETFSKLFETVFKIVLKRFEICLSNVETIETCWNASKHVDIYLDNCEGIDESFAETVRNKFYTVFDTFWGIDETVVATILNSFESVWINLRCFDVVRNAWRLVESSIIGWNVLKLFSAFIETVWILHFLDVNILFWFYSYIGCENIQLKRF